MSTDEFLSFYGLKSDITKLNKAAKQILSEAKLQTANRVDDHFSSTTQIYRFAHMHKQCTFSAHIVRFMYYICILRFICYT